MLRFFVLFFVIKSLCAGGVFGSTEEDAGKAFPLAVQYINSKQVKLIVTVYKPRRIYLEETMEKHVI